jgi:hypothetical protein
MYKMQLNDQDQNANDSLQQPQIISQELDENKPMRQNQDLMSKKSKKIFLVICAVAVLAGTLTGFGAYKLKAKNGGGQIVENVTIDDAAKIKNGDVFGVQDKDTFSDSAIGYIEQGGVQGEGSHKLLREGGETQTVALTSSVVDLDKLVGAEVKLYGETFKAEKAGWFMDVGRVEVVEVNAQAPLQTLD